MAKIIMLNKADPHQQQLFIFWLLLGVLTLLLLSPRALTAQTEPPPLPDNHLAGLVVDFGGGQIETRCVAFAEESISGYQLLERSGLMFGMDASSGIGAAICQIGETGCPSTDCFCQCKGGGSCVYWTYWQLNEGEWGYAQAGASMVRMTDGAVQGWRWGDKSTLEEMTPLSSSFEQICAAELGSRDTAVFPPSSTTTNTPEKAIISQPDAPIWPAYLAFGLMLSLLGVGLVWLQRE